jgi:hypothetical protein
MRILILLANESSVMCLIKLLFFPRCTPIFLIVFYLFPVTFFSHSSLECHQCVCTPPLVLFQSWWVHYWITLSDELFRVRLKRHQLYRLFLFYFFDVFLSPPP